MEDKTKSMREQNIVIQNREKSVITGVEDILSFDDELQGQTLLLSDDADHIPGVSALQDTTRLAEIMTDGALEAALLEQFRLPVHIPRRLFQQLSILA